MFRVGSEIMRYIDGDYAVKNNATSSIPKDSNIVDVYFVRKPHHCKKTNEYWDSKCDESIYLTVRDDNSSIERTVCLAKNEVSETEVYFEDESEKAKFFDEFRDKEFYNHLSIYCPLSDKQAERQARTLAHNRAMRRQNTDARLPHAWGSPSNPPSHRAHPKSEQMRAKPLRRICKAPQAQPRRSISAYKIFYRSILYIHANSRQSRP